MTFAADYCVECSGNGRVPIVIKGPEGSRTSSATCKACGGRGIVKTGAPAEASGMTLSDAITRLEPLITKGNTGPERKALRKILKQAKELKKHIGQYPVLTFRGKDGAMRPEPEVTVQIREIIEHLEKKAPQEDGPPETPETGRNIQPAGPRPADSGTGPLTLQLWNWGLADFSKILKFRFRPE